MTRRHHTRHSAVPALLLLFLAGGARAQSTSGSWETLTGDSPEVDGEVWALAVDEAGRLYAGGFFEHAGGKVVNGVAMWDGSNWHSLAGGVRNARDRGVVQALAVSGGSLYAGGIFRSAGGVASWSIARWDGSNWHSLGSGLGMEYSIPIIVYCIIPDGSGGVYVGGKFHTAGGEVSRGIARWDGERWIGMVGGVSGELIVDFELDEVYSIARDSVGRVYAGGVFNKAGGEAASRIAVCDGDAWGTLGTGISGDGFPGVLALLHDGRDLYAAGTFALAGGRPAANIARWDGESWLPLAEGNCADTMIPALGHFGRTLFVSSSLDCEVPSNERSFGLTWDGAGWKPMGSGTDARINVFAPHRRGVYVGAQQSFRAGSKTAMGIASWEVSNATGHSLPLSPSVHDFQLRTIFPNPASNTANIVIEAGRESRLILTAVNVAGQTVLERGLTAPAGISTISWNAAGLAAGPYFVALHSGDGEPRGPRARPALLILH